MALVDRIAADISRVFMNMEHFATDHVWNGNVIRCVVDEETALKRRNNNVVDISWEANTGDTLIYTPVEGFPTQYAPVPNTHVLFDGKDKKILQVQEDMGVYTIYLASVDARAMVE